MVRALRWYFACVVEELSLLKYRQTEWIRNNLCTTSANFPLPIFHRFSLYTQRLRWLAFVRYYIYIFVFTWHLNIPVYDCVTHQTNKQTLEITIASSFGLSLCTLQIAWIVAICLSTSNTRLNKIHFMTWNMTMKLAFQSKQFFIMGFDQKNNFSIEWTLNMVLSYVSWACLLFFFPGWGLIF